MTIPKLTQSVQRICKARLIFHAMPNAFKLNSKLIKEHKSLTQEDSISVAQTLARKHLGIPNAKISIERVTISGQSYREYCIRKLVLVREKTVIKNTKQVISRKVFPNI